MTYTIEKNGLQPEVVQPEQEQVFVIKYYKTAETADGKEVEVVDEQMTEHITISQLESQKLSHLNAINEIDEKLKKVAELK